MYYDFKVPIPVVQGKITRMNKGNITYIQLETGRKYLPERKYTIPERVSIWKWLNSEKPRMSSAETLQLFEDQPIRIAWDNTEEEWYFSVIDIVDALTDSPNPNNYWKVLKKLHSAAPGGRCCGLRTAAGR